MWRFKLIVYFWWIGIMLELKSDRLLIEKYDVGSKNMKCIDKKIIVNSKFWLMMCLCKFIVVG